MIETLISSKTRVKLLLKFFLNSKTKSYLRSLESEFDESTNAIRLELNKFEKAEMLESAIEGNKKYFRANTQHPLFQEIHNIVLKHVGLDKVVDRIVHKLGNLESVYLTGDFARGIDKGIIDLVFIGDIDKSFLIKKIEEVEMLIFRKIRYLVYRPNEKNEIVWRNISKSRLLLWHEDTKVK